MLQTRLKSLVMKQKSVFFYSDYCLSYGQKPSKNSLFRCLAIFHQFFGYKSEFFFSFFKTDFCLIISDLRRFFMYNTTIFEKTYFWPLFVTFDVTALVGKRCFLQNSNEFRLFIYWSNFRTAEIGQPLILVKKALLEQTLNIRYDNRGIYSTRLWIFFPNIKFDVGF